MSMSSLGSDCGVSHNTVKEWLSVLESSYLVYKLPPHFENFSKRLVKSPKYYFYDTGLLCWLLGIRQAGHISTHPLKGSIFENFVVSELCKSQIAQGREANLYFWRDRTGLEIDLIVEAGLSLTPIEIKAGRTITHDYFKNLRRWMALAGDRGRDPMVIYAGDENQARSPAAVFSWKSVSEIIA